jgi:hypothetical protein
MMKIACPCCGETFTDDQLATLKDEMGEYGPGGTGEPAGEKPDAEPTTMVEAMNRELDDPKKQEARALRKE